MYELSTRLREPCALHVFNALARSASISVRRSFVPFFCIYFGVLFVRTVHSICNIVSNKFCILLVVCAARNLCSYCVLSLLIWYVPCIHVARHPNAVLLNGLNAHHIYTYLQSTNRHENRLLALGRPKLVAERSDYVRVTRSPFDRCACT